MAELTAAAIFSMCNLTSGHCGVLSTTTAILRPARFCWYWMFLSAVGKTSNPARSASASKSPLESVSHPRVLASVIVWPVRKGDNGAGTLWSKRTSIGRGRLYWRNRNRCGEAASGKLQDLDYLLLGDVLPVDDLI